MCVCVCVHHFVTTLAGQKVKNSSSGYPVPAESSGSGGCRISESSGSSSSRRSSSSSRAVMSLGRQQLDLPSGHSVLLVTRYHLDRLAPAESSHCPVGKVSSTCVESSPLPKSHGRWMCPCSTGMCY